MKSDKTSLTLLVSALALGLTATNAHAQFDPESGDTGQWQPPPAQQQPPPQAQPTPPPAQPQQSAWGQQPQQQQQPAWMAGGEERPPALGGEQERPAANGDSDHAQMVGHIGVSYFGFQSIRLGIAAAGGLSVLRAPTIGVRDWFSDSIGFEAGIGLAFSKLSSVSTRSTGEDDIIDGSLDSQLGFALHLGLPVALSHASHFTAVLIPEIEFGYGSAKILDASDPNLDTTFTGIEFLVGARVGGEVHFGFWGLPQLALQGTIGLGLNYSSRTVKDDADLSGGTRTNLSESDTTIHSFVNDIVNGTIRINYYF